MGKEHTESAFADALGAAVARSGKTLSQISAELAQAGHPVTAASLSYWRSGRSVPKRRNSRSVVDALEMVLGTKRGALTEILAASRAANQGRDDFRSHVHNTDREVRRSFDDLDIATSWSNEVTREMLEEEIRVSADFRTVDIKVAQIVRVGSKRATLHVTGFWDEGVPPAPDDIGIYNVLGAQIGATKTEETARGVAKSTTLVIPDSIPQGGLHHVVYERRFGSAQPLKYAIKRAFSWPIKLYMCRVVFDGEVPQGIEWALSSTVDRDESTEKTILAMELEPQGNVVMVTAESLANAVGTVRWR